MRDPFSQGERRIASFVGPNGIAQQRGVASSEPATADAWIVTAVKKCERAVLIGIVERDSTLSMMSYGAELTKPERRGPHRVVGFQFEGSIVCPPGDAEKVTADLAGGFDPAQPRGDHPLTPQRLEGRSRVVAALGQLARTGEHTFGLGGTKPLRRLDRGPERQQQAELASIAAGFMEAFDDLQPTHEIRHRIDIRRAHECFQAGLTQVRHGLLPGLAADGVVGQNLDTFPQSLRVEMLERLYDPRMEFVSALRGYAVRSEERRVGK